MVKMFAKLTTIRSGVLVLTLAIVAGSSSAQLTAVWAKAETAGAQANITMGNYAFNRGGEPEPGDQLASGLDKFLGCAYSSAQATRFENYWNQVTPENAGKWGSVEGTRDNMNWVQLDAAYNLAKDNGFMFRFHVLVWGNQQPSWIESLPPSEQLEEIEEWFAAVAARYPDLDYVEVVNEPLHDPPNQPGSGGGNYINALGGSNDLYGTGWDWIIKSFELARQYFPDSTKLMINDYNIVGSQSSTSQYLTIINLLIERDLIDVIGVQGHAFTTRSASASTITNNLDMLGATGLPIQICEVDIDGLDDQVQLDEYRRIFPTLWEHPSVIGVTLWGWRPGMWRTAQGAYLVDDRGAERPSLQWLRTYLQNPGSIPDSPELISPDMASDVSLNPTLVWRSTAVATAYNLQVAANRIFSAIVLDTTVTDTAVQVGPLATNTSYYWRVSAVGPGGTSEFSNFAIFTTTDQIASIEELAGSPSEFVLSQNYPNPFNPTTEIKYAIAEPGRVTLKVYNMLGQEIVTLFDGRRAAGNYSAFFDGTELSSGVYLYQLKAKGFVNTKKFMLLK